MARVNLSGHLRLLLTEPNNATSLESHSNGWGWHGSHLTPRPSPLTRPSAVMQMLSSEQAGPPNDLHRLGVQP